MREYDDHVRPKRPFLRRVIILLVVIAAVPVVLWSITAFIGTYVAQPKLPTFRPISASATMDTPDSAAAATDPDQANGAGARPIIEARATATDARSSVPLSDRMPTDLSPDADGAAGGPKVATTAAPSAPQSAAPALVTTPAAGGGFAWPDPPGGFGGGNGVSAAQPTDASPAPVDALPPPHPITGRIPLPRHRPHLYAMVQTAAADGPPAGATHTAVMAGVPVPRPRPATAPEATPVVPEVPVTDRLLVH